MNDCSMQEVHVCKGLCAKACVCVCKVREGLRLVCSKCGVCARSVGCVREVCA